MTAPLASATVPVMVPRSDWANAAITGSKRHTARTNQRIFMIFFLSSLIAQPPSFHLRESADKAGVWRLAA